MKIYFSVWGYCDPTRVGYDTVGVTFHKEKPHAFAGIGSNEVYEIELPETFTEEQAKVIGNRAVDWMDKHHNYDPGLAVRTILRETEENDL